MILVLDLRMMKPSCTRRPQSISDIDLDVDLDVVAVVVDDDDDDDDDVYVVDDAEQSWRWWKHWPGCTGAKIWGTTRKLVLTSNQPLKCLCCDVWSLLHLGFHMLGPRPQQNGTLWRPRFLFFLCKVQRFQKNRQLFHPWESTPHIGPHLLVGCSRRLKSSCFWISFEVSWLFPSRSQQISADLSRSQHLLPDHLWCTVANTTAMCQSPSTPRGQRPEFNLQLPKVWSFKMFTYQDPNVFRSCNVWRISMPSHPSNSHWKASFSVEKKAVLFLVVWQSYWANPTRSKHFLIAPRLQNQCICLRPDSCKITKGAMPTQADSSTYCRPILALIS